VSQENVEIVRRMAEAFNSGGLDAARRYYHPEIEWHEDPSFPESGVYRGVEAVIAYNQQFLSEFEAIRYEGEPVASAGEHVVSNMRIAGSGKISGAGFELSAWWAFTVRDGKVVRVYAYLDKDAALEAVGLRE
jgi:ketosteroid isomerase-like protein